MNRGATPRMRLCPKSSGSLQSQPHGHSVRSSWWLPPRKGRRVQTTAGCRRTSAMSFLRAGRAEPEEWSNLRALGESCATRVRVPLTAGMEQPLQRAVRAGRELPPQHSTGQVRAAVPKEGIPPLFKTPEAKERISSALSPIPTSSHRGNPYDQDRGVPKSPRWRRTVRRHHDDSTH